jgi:S-adenosylmethionine hydrolase
MTKPVILHPPRNNPPPITLITDFGLSDGYVGAMKGVIIDVLPWVTVVDITHDIRPQDIRQAAFVLHTAAPHFPQCTVHMVVVDPGVGTDRRPLAVYTDSAVFVGPENGVFPWIYKTQTVREIRELSNSYYKRATVSPTFHGRDLFAPFAAHIAAGVPAPSIGPVVGAPVTFDIPDPKVYYDGSIHGHAIHIDFFGNIITNITEEMLATAQNWTFEIAGLEVRTFRRAYAYAHEDQIFALVGSQGFLEIAIRNGNAAQRLGVKRCDAVIARPAS